MAARAIVSAKTEKERAEIARVYSTTETLRLIQRIVELADEGYCSAFPLTDDNCEAKMFCQGVASDARKVLAKYETKGFRVRVH